MQPLHKAGLALALLTALGLGGRAQAQTFQIAANPNPSLAANPAQGFYYADGSNQPLNPSYFVGQVAINGTTSPLNPTHDYFTFDLSSLNLTGKTITSATLNVPSYFGTSDSGQTMFRFTLYDVSTSPTALNATQPSGNLAIYNDLGSGNSYGAFTVPVSASGVLNFSLNGAALTDIRNSAGGDFSTGGVLSLTNGAALPANSTEFLFSGSDTQSQGRPTLTLVTAPIPEASTTVSLALLLALGAGGLAVARRKRIRA